MQRTINDISKFGNKSIHYGKKAIYYGYIPLIIALGLKTVNLGAMFGEQPPMM